ncbi:hypothetical protein TNCV_418121 [Trichonephila clavipes]|nr:hypothetical protein TNCV_418121 [Trichonephila clavipes]
MIPSKRTYNVEIIAAVTVNNNMLEKDEDVNVEDTLQTPKISLSERLKIVETALQYFEPQGVSIMDLMFHCRLRVEAEKHRVQYGRQDIMHFFKKK